MLYFKINKGHKINIRAPPLFRKIIQARVETESRAWPNFNK